VVEGISGRIGNCAADGKVFFLGARGGVGVGVRKEASKQEEDSTQRHRGREKEGKGEGRRVFGGDGSVQLKRGKDQGKGAKAGLGVRPFEGMKFFCFF